MNSFAFGVALQDKKKLEAWYKRAGKNIPLDYMSSMFLVGAVLARIEEVYGSEGKERVDAAIKHYLDDNDILTIVQALDYPNVNKSATDIALRVQQAVMNETLREKEEEEARRIVDCENKKMEEDNQIVSGQVQGGGKCTFELGRTKGSLREEGGGSTSVRRQDSMNMIEEARKAVERAEVRKSFPESLWD